MKDDKSAEDIFGPAAADAMRERRLLEDLAESNRRLRELLKMNEGSHTFLPIQKEDVMENENSVGDKHIGASIPSPRSCSTVGISSLSPKLEYIGPAFDPITFLQKEIEGLRVQLKAEKSHNAKLIAAVAHLKEAAGIARGTFVGIKSLNSVGEHMSNDDVEDSIDSIAESINDADKLIEPTAEEIKNV